MISILIPVFNRNVVPLVTSLHSQLSAVKEKGEIVVMDDASSDNALKNNNKENLTGYTNINYIELPVNAGRNVIRHKLAAAAKYDTLIFLDADSSFVDALWLTQYLNAIEGDSVIMGGRRYKHGMAGAFTLHFHYGKLREQINAAQRNRYPYRSFLACNFMISKKHLSRLIIDNHLRGYCHEDTFMGLQFEKLKIPVKHIYNPVYHEGIDEDELFINKQKEALENLQYLYHTYYNRYKFNSEIKLIKVYRDILDISIGRYILDKLLLKEEYFKRNALKSHRLIWLDLWKLVVFHRLCFTPAV